MICAVLLSVILLFCNTFFHSQLLIFDAPRDVKSLELFMMIFFCYFSFVCWWMWDAIMHRWNRYFLFFSSNFHQKIAEDKKLFFEIFKKFLQSSNFIRKIHKKENVKKGTENFCTVIETNWWIGWKFSSSICLNY